MTDNFLSKYFEALMNNYLEAKQKLIQHYADEIGIDFRCAKYLIDRQFDYVVEQNPEDAKLFYLTIQPKPVEEILNQEHEFDNECERQLLEVTRK